jgi:hypothetical protein
MEAELGIGVEVVDRCPGTIPVIGEFGVGAVSRHAEFFPFGDVGVRDVLMMLDKSKSRNRFWLYLVMYDIFCVSANLGKFAHGVDSDNAF